MSAEPSSVLADPAEVVRETTIGSTLHRTAAAHPESLALVDVTDGRRWTYRQLEADAVARAQRLLELFEPGDRIAVWAPTSPEWLLTEYAVALAGLVLVTVNPALHADELARVLATARPAGLVLVEEHRDHPLRAIADQVTGPGIRVIDLHRERWQAADPTRPLPEPGPQDIAQIHFTSGTTSAPKAAMLRHRGVTNNTRFHAGVLGLTADDVFLSPIPMFHVGGAVMANLTALNAGAALVPVPAWDPGRVLELIEQERASAILGVPTMFFDLLAHPDLSMRRVDSLRFAMVGGSAVPRELIGRMQDAFGASVRNSFGQTECGSIVAATRVDDAAADVVETVGRPFPGTSARVVDTAGDVVPKGVPGELQVAGYQVMAGYFGQPDLTAAVFTADGWLRTGDVCTMDERGYLRFVSRLREVIVQGGEKIYPGEIEDVLRIHPGVADVAVVGVPDPRLGEAIAAFVQAPPGAAPDPAELRAFGAARLAREKVPRHWVVVAELPRTAAGKVRKPVLRESWAAR